MGSTRDQWTITSRAPGIRDTLVSILLFVVTALFAVTPVMANSETDAAPLDGGWVLLGVLAILAAGLWLQSTRQRQS